MNVTFPFHVGTIIPLRRPVGIFPALMHTLNSFTTYLIQTVRLLSLFPQASRPFPSVWCICQRLGTFCIHLEHGTKRQLVIKCYTKIFKGVRYLHSLTTNTQWSIKLAAGAKINVLHTFSSRTFSLHNTEITDTVFS